MLTALRGLENRPFGQVRDLGRLDASVRGLHDLPCRVDQCAEDRLVPHPLGVLSAVDARGDRLHQLGQVILPTDRLVQITVAQPGAQQHRVDRRLRIVDGHHALVDRGVVGQVEVGWLEDGNDIPDHRKILDARQQQRPEDADLVLLGVRRYTVKEALDLVTVRRQIDLLRTAVGLHRPPPADMSGAHGGAQSCKSGEETRDRGGILSPQRLPIPPRGRKAQQCRKCLMVP
jgi:hypothetical protein